MTGGERGRGRPGDLPDEMLALAIVVSGVLVLDGSAALQVVWLIVVGVAAVLGVVRRSAGPGPGANGSPT